MHVVMMWSGGKDSYLAYHETIAQGFEVSNLFNYVFKEVGRPIPYRVSNLFNFATKNILVNSINHEVSPEIIAIQTQAMEIPLVQFEVTWGTFVDKFKTMIRKIEPTVEGVVFGVEEGDEIATHKNPLHQVCDELGIKLIMPLRGRSEEQNLTNFVEKGFEAIIVVVGTNLLGEEWLGRKIDRNFIHEISRLSRERGVTSRSIEFHTLVTDAPLLKKRLKVLKSRKVSKNGYSVLDISKVELVDRA